jgi:hypothetical protein
MRSAPYTKQVEIHRTSGGGLNGAHDSIESLDRWKKLSCTRFFEFSTRIGPGLQAKMEVWNAVKYLNNKDFLILW